MTPEREKYHELLTEFAASLPDGALVYDIGRTHAHEYRNWFPRQKYKSIDRNPKAEPDILCDLEAVCLCEDTLCDTADALLCNGVTESAGNPFRVVSGCASITKRNAGALFGIRLTGYPLSAKHDLTRFTTSGAASLLTTRGFTVTRAVVVYREGIADPTYGFYFCKAQ